MIGERRLKEQGDRVLGAYVRVEVSVGERSTHDTRRGRAERVWCSIEDMHKVSR